MGTCAYAIKPAGNGFQRGRVFGKVTLTDERSMSGKFTTPHSAHCALFDFIEKSVAHFCALTEWGSDLADSRGSEGGGWGQLGRRWVLGFKFARWLETTPGLQNWFW